MTAKKKVTTDPQPQVEAQTEVPKVDSTSAELIRALVAAIEQTKPVQKKTAANRKPLTPWTPKDGSPKFKLRRKVYQHGLLIDPDLMTNEEISLMNQIKPGRFLDGWVKIFRRRDKGLEITYPIRTASQRLKLVSTFGIRNFKELLERCIEESSNPAKYVLPDED
jgi:hypothetical protein